MSPERFLERFGYLAKAPGGVGRLRELILQLAVRGRLVEQDPGDEPAEVLLGRIRGEKERLVKEGKIKKSKPLSKVDLKELPFQLPKNWVWSHLDDVSQYIQRGKGPKYVESSTVAIISQKCIQWSGFDVSRARFLDPAVISNYQSERFLRSGDLLWNSTGTGTIGRINIFPALKGIGKRFVADSHVTVIRLLCVNPDFIWTWIASPYIQATVESDASGSTNQVELSTSMVKLQPTPIPPLEEQSRIVAKVDQLMSLCDDLEAKQSQRAETHARLILSAHQPLTQARDHAEFQTAWRRIRENFDRLYTSVDAVNALRQTILQLAVQGKLVPQDPNDEPAGVLLERIREEKERLIKEKKIKKSKSLPAVDSGEMPFELPKGWIFSRFSDLVTEVATGPFGTMIHRSDYVSDGVPLINPSHLIDGEVVEDPKVSVSLEVADRLKSYALVNGDIVMARRGEMGRCALVDSRSDGWLCGTGSFVLRFYTDVSRPFILLLFRTPSVRGFLGGNSVGSTMTNLNHGILNKMPVAVPPVGEQSRIVTKVNHLLSLCNQLESKIQSHQSTAQHYAEALIAELAS